MGEIEELRRRLEALEAEVHDMREEQAATRHLAVNSDRDVAAPGSNGGRTSSSCRLCGRHSWSTA